MKDGRTCIKEIVNSKQGTERERESSIYTGTQYTALWLAHPQAIRTSGQRAGVTELSDYIKQFILSVLCDLLVDTARGLRLV